MGLLGHPSGHAGLLSLALLLLRV